MRRQNLIVPLVAALLLAGACGKSEEQVKEDTATKLDNAGKQMERAAKELEDAAKKGGQGMADAMAKMGVAVGGAVGEAAKTVGSAIEPVATLGVYSASKAALVSLIPDTRTTGVSCARSLADRRSSPVTCAMMAMT